jgi:hypothetical protein
MFRVLLLLLITASAILPARREILGSETGPTGQSDQQRKAEALVRQLGDEQFSKRERATEELIELGISALDALQEGERNPDREIRYRSARIVRIVRDLDFQRRLQAFASDHDDSERYDLPGWKIYRELIGDDAACRSMFVLMQKQESGLLQAIERGPRVAADKLGTRCQELQHAMRYVQQQLELGSVAAFLFAAVQPDVAVTAQCSSSIYTFCYQNSFRAGIEEGPHKELLRKLLGIWIRQCESSVAYQGLMLAMRYDLKDGLVAAERLLQMPNNPSHIRQYAILTLAKLGDASHIPQLESMFADKTPCTTRRVNNVQYETQIRDVALAAVLHLSKLDLKEYGYSSVQVHTQYLFNPGSLGFQNDQQRDQAIAKWQAWKANEGKGAAEGVTDQQSPGR